MNDFINYKDNIYNKNNIVFISKPGLINKYSFGFIIKLVNYEEHICTKEFKETINYFSDKYKEAYEEALIERSKFLAQLNTKSYQPLN